MADTIDDLLRFVIEGILASGRSVVATKGPMKEVTGFLLELTNPRARLSRTETRGKPYSCLGELCWYLAGSKALSFISYYIRQYQKYADGDEIFGGYGPRLFDWKGVNQLANIIACLKKKPSSRQAVVQLFDALDISVDHNDVPCTCTLQFMVRDAKLHLIANMRSNDVFLGLPHDVFCFTMLQELVARTLSVDVGRYKHAVGSLHLYDYNISSAKRFLDEGWQSTAPMPPMPLGDPWPAIKVLVQAESNLRTGNLLDPFVLGQVDPYWADLIRLLEVFRCKKERQGDRIRELDKTMASEVYHVFIESALSRLR